MTLKMTKLLALLRRLEVDCPNMTERDFEDFARTEAGYKEIRTYRSKILDGRLLFRREDDPVSLYVRGAVDMTSEDFAELLSQRKGNLTCDSQDEWRRAIRELATEGQRRSYRVDANDRDLLLGLLST